MLGNLEKGNLSCQNVVILNNRISIKSECSAILSQSAERKQLTINYTVSSNGGILHIDEKLLSR